MTHSGIGFYVATAYARKPDAAAVADLLEARFPLSCTARWVRTQPTFKDNGLGGELEGEDALNAAIVAQEDLEDIEAGDLFIQLTSGEKARGGRHVEMGYAIAKTEGRPWRKVIAVGPKEHAFHYTPGVVSLATVDDLAIYLDGYLAVSR